MTFIIFKIIGYLGWLTTTALGICGSWFWTFTEEDPNNPNRKRLTPAGRKAKNIMIISVVFAVASTTYTEVNSYFSSIIEKEDKIRLQGNLDEMRLENSELSLTVRQLLRRHGLLKYAAGDRNLRSLIESFIPHIRGREEERARLSEMTNQALPFGSIGILATFNLRDPSRKEPVPDRMQRLATIISLMEADIVWLQEISKQYQLQTLRQLLPHYEVRWANVGRKQGAPGTGLAMLYRKATVDILGEPEFLPNIISKEGDKETPWYRVPFTQTIRIGKLNCQLLNVRLFWGGASGTRLERRIKEMNALLKWLTQRRTKDPIIIGGCFNWALEDTYMTDLRNTGFYFPTAYLPINATESSYSKNIRRYSHFCLSPDLKENYIQGSVRYQSVKPLFPDWSEKQLREFADLKPLLITLRVQ